MKQSTRVGIAVNTLEILKAGFYINHKNKKIIISHLQSKAERGTVLFTPQKLDELIWNQQTGAAISYEVTNETTLDAARRLSAEDNKVLCLNFASAKNPGGGFMSGALAQEESIARASGLYSCLLKAKPYYDFHRNLTTCLYSDHMIYSPEVPVFKDEEGALLEKPVLVSFITSPAVNAGVIERNEPANIPQIVPVMRKRIDKLLKLSLYNEQAVLVLGAWGCGVFQNDPKVIAQLFSDALTGPFMNQFKRIVFAVKTNKEEMITPFRDLFLGN